MVTLLIVLFGIGLVVMILGIVIARMLRPQPVSRQSFSESSSFGSQIVLAQRAEIDALRREIAALQATHPPASSGSDSTSPSDLPYDSTEMRRLKRHYIEEIETLKVKYEVEIETLCTQHQTEVEAFKKRFQMASERSQLECAALEVRYKVQLQDKDIKLQILASELDALHAENDILTTAQRDRISSFYTHQIQILSDRLNYLQQQIHHLNSQRELKKQELSCLLSDLDSDTGDEQSFKQFEYQQIKLDTQEKTLADQITSLMAQQSEVQQLLRRFQTRHQAIASTPD